MLKKEAGRSIQEKQTIWHPIWMHFQMSKTTLVWIVSLLVIGLRITHIETAKLNSSKGEIPLRNILCIPNMKMNLLSIKSMAKDLKYSLILNESGSIIQDNDSGKNLIKGNNYDGL